MAINLERRTAIKGMLGGLILATISPADSLALPDLEIRAREGFYSSKYGTNNEAFFAYYKVKNELQPFGVILSEKPTVDVAPSVGISSDELRNRYVIANPGREGNLYLEFGPKSVYGGFQVENENERVVVMASDGIVIVGGENKDGIPSVFFEKNGYVKSGNLYLGIQDRRIIKCEQMRRRKGSTKLILTGFGIPREYTFDKSGKIVEAKRELTDPEKKTS